MVFGPMDQSEQPGDLSQPMRAGSAAPTSSVATLTGVIPEHLLDEGEAVLLAIKPSLWFILFSSAKVIFAVAAALVLLWKTQSAHEISFRTICQFAAVAILLQVTVAFFLWLSRLYVLTNRRVMRIKGVFNIDIFEASLPKIQNTFLTLAIHERVVRLGSIQFTTAGTAGIEASWQNINHPLEVHEIIRRAIRQSTRSPTANGGL